VDDVFKAAVIAVTVAFGYGVAQLWTLAVTNNNKSLAKMVGIMTALILTGFFWAIWGPRLGK
jgi:hypothetical protein